jgi:hypothetical protein
VLGYCYLKVFSITCTNVCKRSFHPLQKKMIRDIVIQ